MSALLYLFSALLVQDFMKNSSNVKLPGKVFIFIYTVCMCIYKKICCLESIVSNHAVFSNKNSTIIVSGGQYPSNQFPDFFIGTYLLYLLL